MRRAILSAVIVLAITVTVALTATLGSGDAPRPHPADTIVAGARAADPVAQLPQVEAVAAYLQGVERQQVDQYLAAAHAEMVAYLASLPAPTPPPAPSAPVAEPVSPQVSGTGGCATGGGSLDAVPAYIVQRESGGNYCAANPSGACGAYQIMPGTWAGFGGYASACDAPPAVQDEKARTKAACNWEPPNYCAG